MAKLQEYEFLQCEDGVYFGRPLKNGRISKDARKISANEIVQLFSCVLEDYCLRYQKSLVVERNGKPFIEATIIL